MTYRRKIATGHLRVKKVDSSWWTELIALTYREAGTLRKRFFFFFSSEEMVRVQEKVHANKPKTGKGEKERKKKSKDVWLFATTCAVQSWNMDNKSRWLKSSAPVLVVKRCNFRRDNYGHLTSLFFFPAAQGDVCFSIYRLLYNVFQPAIFAWGWKQGPFCMSNLTF